MAPDLVPRTVLSPPSLAGRRVALVVAAASGAAGLAGLWFRIDDGLVFRVVLALTSAVFGWLTMDVALSATDAPRAAMRAIGLSVVLGAASTVYPCLVIGSTDRLAYLIIGIPFGGFCGAIVGFAYGIVLAFAAAATWRQVSASTHEGADRAVRVAAVWTILPLAFTALVVFGHDLQAELAEWASESRRDAHELAVPLGMLAMGIALAVAIGSYWVATQRLSRRRRWLADVTSGRDPRWGVREIGPHDDLGRLPRLGQGFAVLEHKNEHAVYRANATGEAIAII